MSAVRIIPRMEVKSRNVVKGIRMEGLRIVGKPDDLAEEYFKEGADEIIYDDIVASLYSRSYDLSDITQISPKIMVPLCIGGGIQSVEDVHHLLESGADKVSMNTHAVRRPELITEAAHAFGSQCVMVQIQAKRQLGGTWEAYLQSGRDRSGREVIAWAREAQERGAGEIFLMSVDRDGHHSGPDIELIRAVTKAVSIPVIAGGGVRTIDHIEKMIVEGGCQAVALSQILHSKIQTIGTIKAELKKRGISVRD